MSNVSEKINYLNQLLSSDIDYDTKERVNKILYEIDFLHLQPSDDYCNCLWEQVENSMDITFSLITN